MNSSSTKIDHVDRIAERIVANELEFRGFRVLDLNLGRLSENADLLAARSGKTLQIQVKGASNRAGELWVQYGFCNEDIIAKKGRINRISPSFYKAEIVVLVAVRSPKEYSCLVLPVETAEKAAQVNLDCYYRTLTLTGATKKPGMVSVYLDRIPNTQDPSKKTLLLEEARILEAYKDKWEILSEPLGTG